jgi:hypothetical protein
MKRETPLTQQTMLDGYFTSFGRVTVSQIPTM